METSNIGPRTGVFTLVVFTTPVLYELHKIIAFYPLQRDYPVK